MKSNYQLARGVHLFINPFLIHKCKKYFLVAFQVNFKLTIWNNVDKVDNVVMKE